MNNPQSRPDVGMPFSRYENKKNEIAAGLREPFEFKDSRRRELDTFEYGETSVRIFKEKPKKVVPKTITPPAVILSEGRAIATVVDIRLDLYCAFLVTTEGQTIYLGLRVAKHFMGEVKLVKGLQIDLWFRHLADAKYPKVEKIFSVQPKKSSDI